MIDSIERFFDILYGFFCTFVLHGIDNLLNILIYPIESSHPALQITVVAIVGAGISRMIGSRFYPQQKNALHLRMKTRLLSLRDADAIEDGVLKSAVRKGIHDDADRIYEHIIIDKMTEMGVAYFLPLFFFLIWLEYSRFTPEKLNLLTGSVHAWTAFGGVGFSAATLYVYIFNLSLICFWLLTRIVGYVGQKTGARHRHHET